MELASEEDALRYQCGDKHGADNGEHNHRGRRFLLSCRLGVKHICLDRFLHDEADGEIKGDGIAVVVLARDGERSAAFTQRVLRRCDRELRLLCFSGLDRSDQHALTLGDPR